MHLFKQFINTIRYYLEGKGNPLRLIILWWFFLNAFSLIAGFYMTIAFAKLDGNTLKYLGALLCLLGSILGLIIIIIYPIIFIISAWRCAKNTNSRVKLCITRLFIIPFCIFHGYLSFIYGMGTYIMLGNFILTIKEILKY